MSPDLSKESIIKLAQFLAGLTSHQDMWVEISGILFNTLNSDLVAFGETCENDGVCISYIAFNENGSMPGCLKSKEGAGQIINEENLHGEIKAKISETMESGFITMSNYSAQVPISMIFLPLNRSNRLSMVMVIGYYMNQMVEKDLLNDLLAVAGLIESVVTKLNSDKELKHYQENLEALVSERTDQLTITNNKLQKEMEQRISAEKALNINIENMTRVLESMEDYIYIVNKDYKIEYMNSAFKTAFQTGIESNQKCFEILNDKPEICSWCNLEVVLAGSPYRREWQSKKHGNIFDVLETPILNKDGSSSMLAIFRDITDRKKTEETLRLQARERAAVDTFTYSVSNDLQAPLRRIQGFSEALLEECPDELSDQAQDYLNRITTQVSSMKNLTDALLQLSRVVSREINRETIDLSALIRSNLEKLKFKEPERQPELVVEPGLITEGDPELLNLMLGYLLDNAWKFTFGIEKAQIECGSIVKDGRTVYFVKDNGVGFDQQRADEIFNPFKKLHSETDYPGIGIGLNLVYRIISRHGGEIWAEGEEGKGACFYFTLS